MAKIDIGGNQGRGNPDTRPAPLSRRNRIESDSRMIDPDSAWQDSAQAMLYGSEAPRIPRDRSPLSWGALVAAIIVVGLCAGTVIVACVPK